ncbi:MAG: amino acid ABC transporter permease, partial [Alphaproteobacteria bacterium]|nr:amino acid ABC transporter permease [Alphaproteobacteria bacterium]
MSFDWPFFWSHLLAPSQTYLQGLGLTLVLSVVSQTLGSVIGLFAALGRSSRLAPVRSVIRFYVWVMR